MYHRRLARLTGGHNALNKVGPCTALTGRAAKENRLLNLALHIRLYEGGRYGSGSGFIKRKYLIVRLFVLNRL